MKTEIEYKTPLTISDKPVGRCWMVDMGKSKWEMEFEISTGTTIHCTGKQLGCFYHLEKRKPTLAPQNLFDQYHNEMR